MARHKTSLRDIGPQPEDWFEERMRGIIARHPDDRDTIKAKAFDLIREELHNLGYGRAMDALENALDGLETLV